MFQDFFRENKVYAFLLPTEVQTYMWLACRKKEQGARETREEGRELPLNSRIIRGLIANAVNAVKKCLRGIGPVRSCGG